MAGDPWVHEELVPVDQIQSVKFCRELAATEQHADRGRILELLQARAKIAGEVVAVVICLLTLITASNFWVYREFHGLRGNRHS